MPSDTRMIEEKREALDKLLSEMGFANYMWIDPRKIVVAQWVRMKCRYGCSGYGSNASCPPNVPSVAECERFLSEYRSGVIIRYAKKMDTKEELSAWYRSENKKLLELERKVFLSGYQKAFVILMNPCNFCKECGDADGNCIQPKNSRPAPEGFAIDVYSTAHSAGLPIQVVTDHQQEMNRYGFLLVE